MGERSCDVDSGTTLQKRLSISLSFCLPNTLFVKFPAIYEFIVNDMVRINTGESIRLQEIFHFLGNELRAII